MDPNYLREHQYEDDKNFNARFELHERYSINPYDYYRWIFDQLDLPYKCVILELGCGPGHLWLKNRDRLSAGWDITLSDFSAGMLDVAQRNLGALSFPFKFAIIDAQAIPITHESVDVVLANHMLYHLHNRLSAIFEIYRILKPGGRLYASTSGINHLKELGTFLRIAATANADDYGDDESAVWVPVSFSLDNGLDQLAPWFPKIELRRYKDGLRVTRVEPLLEWVTSCLRDDIESSTLRELSDLLASEIKAKGFIHLSKDTGIFIASRERC
jgi:SAM-dependent methyltransferase